MQENVCFFYLEGDINQRNNLGKGIPYVLKYIEYLFNFVLELTLLKIGVIQKCSRQKTLNLVSLHQKLPI